MREKSFPIGSIIRGGESIYLKDSDGRWSAFDLEERLTADEVQEFFDSKSPYAEKFEVLNKPDPVLVLENLPSGSVVSSGHEVAVRLGQDWAVGGSKSRYASSAVLVILGNEFEVLRRGAES